MIEQYFYNVEQKIQLFQNIKTYKLTKKIYNSKQGLISGTITFEDYHQLEFAEVKNIEKHSKIKYRYHYMDKNKDQIFRYDNAPHHKHLSTFPHHKHIVKDVKESIEPNLEDVLLEIAQLKHRI